MVNVVGIPSKERFDLLRPLLEQLLDDYAVDKIYVCDNGYTGKDQDYLWDMECARLEVVEARHKNIYGMWNYCHLLARIEKADTLTLLNDDVSIPFPFVSPLSKALVDNPDLWVIAPDYQGRNTVRHEGGVIDRVTGTYKDHGMPGFAFMLNMSKFLRYPFDESYGWWFGDDDFVNTVELEGGKIGVLNGVTIQHVGTATGKNYDFSEQIAKDAERYKSKWPQH